MYNALLQNVINVVNATTKTTSVQDTIDEMTSKYRDPERYEELVTRRHKKEDMGNKVILIATGAAVAGEIGLAIKRSGMLKKVFNR